jgi:hypothetical protein
MVIKPREPPWLMFPEQTLVGRVSGESSILESLAHDYGKVLVGIIESILAYNW